MKKMTLTADELNRCIQTAHEITREAHAHGANDRNLMTGNEDANEASCCAKYAFAKMLGIPWDFKVVRSHSNDVKKEAGLINNCRIRVRLKAWHDLIVQETDEDSANIVLCIAEKPDEPNFIGYINGKVAKQTGKFATYLPRPGYLIKQSELKPIADLLPKEEVCQV